MRNCSIPWEILQLNLCHIHNLVFTSKNIWLTPTFKFILLETEYSKGNLSLTKIKGTAIKASHTYLFLRH